VINTLIHQIVLKVRIENNEANKRNQRICGISIKVKKRENELEETCGLAM